MCERARTCIRIRAKLSRLTRDFGPKFLGVNLATAFAVHTKPTHSQYIYYIKRIYIYVQESEREIKRRSKSYMPSRNVTYRRAYVYSRMYARWSIKRRERSYLTDSDMLSGHGAPNSGFRRFCMLLPCERIFASQRELELYILTHILS